MAKQLNLFDFIDEENEKISNNKEEHKTNTKPKVKRKQKRAKQQQISLFDFIYEETNLTLENERSKNAGYIDISKKSIRLGDTERASEPKSISRLGSYVVEGSEVQTEGGSGTELVHDESDTALRNDRRDDRFNQEDGRLGRTSIGISTTNESGDGSTGEQGSRKDERARDNRDGDTTDVRNSSVQVLSTIHRKATLLDFKSNEEIYIAGAKDKYTKNIQAIKIIKELENHNRHATKEEQTALSLYTGWGGIPQVFDEKNDKWSKEYNELKEILSKEEYEDAFFSTQDSHYTPKLIIDTIYQGLNHFGFNNTDDKKDILEPSAGNGAFLSFRDNENYNFRCIEKDKISSNILKHLYPNQTISHKGFEKYNAPILFDAVIGNPPYGNKKIYDANNAEISMQSVHNYFLTRSLNELKDGGIGAFVVSSFVMDAKNSDAREYINQHGTFLGAVRLPNDVFKNKAGTEVTTDIIFFQKGKNEELKQSWSEIKEHDKDININEYFINNPQNILGNMQRVMSGIGEQTQCIANDDLNLEHELKKFIDSLPKDIFLYEKREQKQDYFSIKKTETNKEEYDRLSKKRENTYCVIDDEVYKKINSNEDDVLSFQKQELSKLDKKRVIKIDEIRNTLNELIELEQTDIKDENPKLINQRKKFNNLYDDFVKKEGFLNRPANKKAFGEDIEAKKLLALEISYDKGVSKSVAAKNQIEPKEPSAKKADIFSKRTISPHIAPVITNPKEALSASLNLFGKIDGEYMSDQLNKPKEQIIKELIDEKLIFIDPKTIKEDDHEQYILSSKYLSGNVKEKLKEIETLLHDYPNELATNYEALKEIQPKDLTADEIHVTIGTSWIPLNYYQEFFEEHFKTSKDDFSLNFNVKTGEWRFQGEAYKIDQATISKYATERIGIYSLAEYALKRKTLVIQDKVLATDDQGNQLYNDKGEEKYKYVTNHEETTKANAKLEKLKSDFKDWIYKDYGRRKHLEQIYNDTFNTDVIPQYDGSHLEFSGLNAKFNLRSHQKNAIWRAINEQSVLMDHQVGAGKTLVAISSAMEQKRMGLINKPLIIVPNHLLSQWSEEFYQAYPNANILVAEKKDLEKNNREQFFGRIATNNYDAVIMTHSQFKFLPSPFKILKEQMEDDIQTLKDILDEQEEEAKREGKKGFSVKQTAKKIENLEAKLDDLIQNNKKSKSLDFSELGIDALIVDESHEFKNLLITTSMGNIAGLGSINGSQKAYDMISKTRYMHNNGYKINFLSGTPISNSITELYTLQRYLQPNELEKKGIQSFDAWASTFAQTKASWELDTSANNYKLVTRLNEFVGLPELTKMYRSFADTVTNTDIKKLNGDFLPKLENDKPFNEISKRSNEIAEFIGIQDENGHFNEGSIIYRMEHFDQNPRRNNMLACTTDARKAGLDYRLIEPNADDYKDSKANKLSENIFNEWEKWSEQKGTQLVFCDLSTPKIHSQKVDIDEPQTTNGIKQNEFININDAIEEDSKEISNDEIIANSSKFDIYSDLLKKLTAKGIPQEQIRFIHDASTDLQKAQLFSDVNSGKVRILIGSTSKMGAGTNVQKRVTAIHHADCPWRPSDLEQRNGRVIRQGNLLFEQDKENFRIKEFRYATEKTYDARMWQVIEQKAQAIEQFRMGGIERRSMEDVSMGSADASEMKAEATGNPFILMQVQLTNDLKQEEALYNSFHADIYRNENALRNSKSHLEYSQKKIEKLERIKEHLKDYASENFTCRSYIYGVDGEVKTQEFTIYKDDNSEANKQNQKELKKIFDKNISHLVSKTEREMSLFEYNGLKIVGERVDLKRVEFYLENEDKKILITPHNLIYEAKSGTIDFSRDISFDGFFTRINNYFKNIDNYIDKENIKIKTHKRNIEELEKVTGDKAPCYDRKAYLEALRVDNNAILREIQKLSKNKDYKSSWQPSSQKIKEAMKNKATTKEKTEEKKYRKTWIDENGQAKMKRITQTEYLSLNKEERKDYKLLEKHITNKEKDKTSDLFGNLS